MIRINLAVSVAASLAAFSGFAAFLPLEKLPPDRIVDNGAKVEIVAGDVFITADRPVSEVKLVWNCDFAGAKILGDTWERAYGDLFWRPVTLPRAMPWYFLCKDGGRTDGYGVMTQPNAFACWRTDGKTLTLAIDLRAAGRPVELKGRRLHAVTLVSRKGGEGESAFASGTEFCKLMCPKPRLANDPIYGYNDWYCAYGKQTAEGFLRDAAPVIALCDGLKNRPYAVVDDGWQRDGAREDYGWGEWAWTGSSPHFGMDMKTFTAKVAALGAKPGLWYRPLLAWPGAAKDELQLACSKTFDPTVESVRARIAADIRRFRGWGMKLVKIDFLTNDLSGLWICDYQDAIDAGNFIPAERVWRDSSRTSAEVIKDLYRTMREAAGDEMAIIGCNAVNHLAAGLFEGQRTADDTSGRDWFHTLYNGVNILAMRAIQNGTFFQADPDCVGLAEKGAVDWTKNEQWLDAIARSGQTLFVSWRHELMDDAVRSALRSAYALAAVPRVNGEPLDWESRLWPREWKFADGRKTYAWSDHDRPGEGSYLLGRFPKVAATMLEIEGHDIVRQSEKDVEVVVRSFVGEVTLYHNGFKVAKQTPGVDGKVRFPLTLVRGVNEIRVESDELSDTLSWRYGETEGAPAGAEVPKYENPRTAWFEAARFGLFIHWGIYSIPAKGEWAYAQLLWKPGEYEALREKFNPVDYNPREWAKLAKAAGMKYVVFTTRHHDGFCMFDSHFTDYKITKTPYGKDTLKMLVEAFRAEGLKIGFYHSLPDWTHPGYTDLETPAGIHTGKAPAYNAEEHAKYKLLVRNHVNQLTTEYGKIDLMFFDYTSKFKDGVDYFDRDALVAICRKNQPDIMINDRLAYFKDQAPDFDYYTPEVTVPPASPIVRGTERPWETCATMNGHWGYAADDHDFKSVETIVAGLVGCVSHNGNLLLNVGPTERGTFPEESVTCLKGLADWYAKNGESITGCGRSDFQPPFGCAYTQKGNTLYCHILTLPMGDIILPGLDGKTASLTLLRTGKTVPTVDFWGFETLRPGDLRIRPVDLRIGDVIRIRLRRNAFTRSARSS